MSDDLRDKFGSDDEYEDFKNSYDNYKNKKGMFDIKVTEQYLKMLMELQELVYKSFLVEDKKYFKVPEEFSMEKNSSLYMFHFKKTLDFEAVISIYLN